MNNIIVDNIKFELKEYHDFSWLLELGHVFTVYYNQDAGNLLFGVEKDGVKKFVKYAGAKPIEYEGTPEDAILRLEKAIIVYQNIKHSNLINLEKVIRCPNGIATVSEWFDGHGLHEAWTYGEYDKYTSPNSFYYQYRHMPVAKRLQSVHAVFEFLTYVESIGYVSIDLYDGSIMYDFEHGITKICDVDFFRKKPAVNDIGEDFWGSKRFKAPEEYIYGATIDEITTVYTWGAILFHFFGSYTNRNIMQMYETNCFFPCSLENWELSNPLYDIANKAVNKDKSQRYNSMSDFLIFWDKALCTI